MDRLDKESTELYAAYTHKLGRGKQQLNVKDCISSPYPILCCLGPSPELIC